MGMVLQFRTTDRTTDARGASGPCEVVIFPGVRIERHGDADELDLGARLTEMAGGDTFDGAGGGRPRKTS